MENYIKFDSEITEYKCPHCQKGYLLLDKKYFFEKQYESSIKKSTFKINDYEEDYDDIGCGPDDVSRSFRTE